MRRSVTLLALFLGVWPASAIADPARERELAERVVQAWPEPDPDEGLSRVVRSVFEQRFGIRMTPYAWRQAEIALRPRIVPWSEIRPHLVDALVAELNEAELDRLVTLVSSAPFEKMAPHLPEVRQATSDEQAEAVLRAYLTNDEILQLVDNFPLLARVHGLILRAGTDLGVQNADRFRDRIMARCPQRTEPLPWCER